MNRASATMPPACSGVWRRLTAAALAVVALLGAASPASARPAQPDDGTGTGPGLLAAGLSDPSAVRPSYRFGGSVPFWGWGHLGTVLPRPGADPQARVAILPPALRAVDCEVWVRDDLRDVRYRLVQTGDRYILHIWHWYPSRPEEFYEMRDTTPWFRRMAYRTFQNGPITFTLRFDDVTSFGTVTDLRPGASVLVSNLPCGMPE